MSLCFVPWSWIFERNLWKCSSPWLKCWQHEKREAGRIRQLSKWNPLSSGQWLKAIECMFFVPLLAFLFGSHAVSKCTWHTHSEWYSFILGYQSYPTSRVAQISGWQISTTEHEDAGLFVSDVAEDLWVWSSLLWKNHQPLEYLIFLGPALFFCWLPEDSICPCSTHC